jgi:hypothetical protein
MIGNLKLPFKFGWGLKRNSSSGLIARVQNISMQSIGIFEFTTVEITILNRSSPI